MNAWHTRVAIGVLCRGGHVLHATEGVWGLACDPWNRRAVERLLAIKRRDAAKGLIVIGAEAGEFAPELEALEGAQRGQVEAGWPGPVTWVLPSRRFPEWIGGGRGTVAVRVPGHPQARALCRAFGGPLVSTSANRSGRAPARRRWQARALLRELAREEPDTAGDLYLLPGETLGRSGPSELWSLDGGAARRLR